MLGCGGGGKGLPRSSSVRTCPRLPTGSFLTCVLLLMLFRDLVGVLHGVDSVMGNGVTGREHISNQRMVRR